MIIITIIFDNMNIMEEKVIFGLNGYYSGPWSVEYCFEHTASVILLQ